MMFTVLVINVTVHTLFSHSSLPNKSHKTNLFDCSCFFHEPFFQQYHSILTFKQLLQRYHNQRTTLWFHCFRSVRPIWAWTFILNLENSSWQNSTQSSLEQELSITSHSLHPRTKLPGNLKLLLSIYISLSIKSLLFSDTASSKKTLYKVKYPSWCKALSVLTRKTCTFLTLDFMYIVPVRNNTNTDFHLHFILTCFKALILRIAEEGQS